MNRKVLAVTTGLLSGLSLLSHAWALTVPGSQCCCLLVGGHFPTKAFWGLVTLSAWPFCALPGPGRRHTLGQAVLAVATEVWMSPVVASALEFWPVPWAAALLGGGTLCSSWPAMAGSGSLAGLNS